VPARRSKTASGLRRRAETCCSARIGAHLWRRLSHLPRCRASPVGSRIAGPFDPQQVLEFYLRAPESALNIASSSGECGITWIDRGSANGGNRRSSDISRCHSQGQVTTQSCRRWRVPGSLRPGPAGNNRCRAAGLRTEERMTNTLLTCTTRQRRGAITRRGCGARIRSARFYSNTRQADTMFRGALAPPHGNRSGHRWALCSTVMI
jgi:hypothetical protein